MAKRIITNPEFVNAPYELRYEDIGGRVIPHVVHRFKTPWPENLKPKNLRAWIFNNSIPQFIEVEDAANPVS